MAVSRQPGAGRWSTSALAPAHEQLRIDLDEPIIYTGIYQLLRIHNVVVGELCRRLAKEAARGKVDKYKLAADAMGCAPATCRSLSTGLALYFSRLRVAAAKSVLADSC